MGYTLLSNRFLIACVAFLDPEHMGFVTLFARFGHDFTELCLKNEFYIMAELICILCKLHKGARVASSGFLIWTPQIYQNCKKRCMDGKSRLTLKSAFHIRTNAKICPKIHFFLHFGLKIHLFLHVENIFFKNLQNSLGSGLFC